MDEDQRLRDRAAIRETIERYFFAVDSKDAEMLRLCFTAEAAAEYHRHTPEQRTVTGAVNICADIHASCARFGCSTHCIGSSTVEIAGNLAHADTFAVAHVLLGDTMLVRGLRYEDELTRTPHGWQIHRRRHTPQWQYEVPSRPPKLF